MNDEQHGIKNDVVLCGPVAYPELKTVAGGRKMFKGKIHNINIVAWGNIAERMGEDVEIGDTIKISGVISERRFENKCKSCGNPYFSYWTQVEVYAFNMFNEEEELDG